MLAFASCSENEGIIEQVTGQRTSDLSGYKIVVNATVGGATRMNPESGQWQDGDIIYIALDGDDSNSYSLRYSAADGNFTILSLNGASAGFAESGKVTGLYASSADLGYGTSGVSGTTWGDAVYTEQGTYTKADGTITINMNLNERKMSLVKLTGLDKEAYVSNMKATYTKLIKLSTPTWEAGTTTPSYVYDAANKVAYCYGTLPDDGKITVKYVGGLSYVINTAVTSLAPGEMTEVASPDAAPDSWAIDESEYYHTGDVYTYNQATSAKAFTIVVVPEAYQQADLAKDGGKFVREATAAMDYLFSVEPYNRLKQYFNVYFIMAVSKDAGADKYTDNDGTTIEEDHDTYFNVGWSKNNNQYNQLGATSGSKVYEFVNTYCPDLNGKGSFKGDIDNTAILVLINDSRYAGMCRFERSGRCITYVPNSPGTKRWNNTVGAPQSVGTMNNIVVHELGGHGIGRAEDEYIYNNTGEMGFGARLDLGVKHVYKVPFGMNLTTSKTDYGWDWMNGKGYTGEGLWEGGSTYQSGVWRPEELSCMADNRPYFNAFTRYLIVKRIYDACGINFSQDIFMSQDSKKSSYKNAAGAKSQYDTRAAVNAELVPMTARPVCER